MLAILIRRLVSLVITLFAVSLIIYPVSYTHLTLPTTPYV